LQPPISAEMIAVAVAQEAFQHFHGAVLVLDREQLLDHDRRRAHRGGNEHVVLVLEILRPNDRDGAVCAIASRHRSEPR
jgi:hypothetical protein